MLKRRPLSSLMVPGANFIKRFTAIIYKCA
jgi:hypothetical protein